MCELPGTLDVCTPRGSPPPRGEWAGTGPPQPAALAGPQVSSSAPTTSAVTPAGAARPWSLGDWRTCVPESCLGGRSAQSLLLLHLPASALGELSALKRSPMFPTKSRVSPRGHTFRPQAAFTVFLKQQRGVFPSLPVLCPRPSAELVETLHRSLGKAPGQGHRAAQGVHSEGPHRAWRRLGSRWAIPGPCFAAEGSPSSPPDCPFQWPSPPALSSTVVFPRRALSCLRCGASWDQGSEREGGRECQGARGRRDPDGRSTSPSARASWN